LKAKIKFGNVSIDDHTDDSILNKVVNGLGSIPIGTTLTARLPTKK
jgi:hypothetical protein